MDTLLSETDEGLRRVVARVALLNLAYFGVEFSVALAIGSVSLFADSIDFLENTYPNVKLSVHLSCIDALWFVEVSGRLSRIISFPFSRCRSTLPLREEMVASIKGVP